MRIRCPFCGERESAEFTYLGDGNPGRPDLEAPDAAVRAFEAVYVRLNPCGRHEELWYHGSGCRSWLLVTRDTRTHEIFDVQLASERAVTP